MNPGPINHGPGQPPAKGLTVDDIIYTLFRHKWLLLAFLGLSVVGAVGVRLVRPPLYISKAKLMVHYVAPSSTATPGKEAEGPRPLDANAQTIIASEIEILTSLDVAAQVVDKVGAERILALKGGGSNRLAAAGVVASGIEVDPPRSSIITVSFKHPDETVVQPVLEALIQTYMRKHVEVHQRLGVLDDYFSRTQEELRRKLAQTEEELKQLKTRANVLFLDDTKRAYQSQIAKIQDSLLEAERELAERRAVLGDLTGSAEGATNSPAALIPREKLGDYSFITAELDSLKRRERELLLRFKEAHPEVQTVQGQIAKLTQQKQALEEAYPALSQYVGAGGGTNAPGGDVGAELVEIKRLSARVAILGQSLSNIQAQAAQVLEMEPRINELTRQRDEEERNYHSVVSSIEQRQLGATAVSGKVINMSIVENPTPPKRDFKKMLKLLAVVVVGCLGLGVGLAFTIEMVLDRSIKRAPDVERLLKLPVFLTIPDSTWTERLGRWWRGDRRPDATAGQEATSLAVAKWDPRDELKSYAEGLRERVITYFEVNNQNLKKPKLVAVTACNRGAGVSTLASGLAAELSKTGDGNVLLVDMNEANHGMAHSFYRGQPGCGLAEVLEEDKRAEAQVEDRLFVASMQDEGAGRLAMVLPKHFSQLMPKLKASNYDYIIFDMPAVTQTSATPRLAGHMDITLLVLEAEKTGRQAAARAAALMRQSRANVAAVLNKCRQHVPTRLSEDW